MYGGDRKFEQWENKPLSKNIEFTRPVSARYVELTVEFLLPLQKAM